MTENNSLLYSDTKSTSGGLTDQLYVSDSGKDLHVLNGEVLDNRQACGCDNGAD